MEDTTLLPFSRLEFHTGEIFQLFELEQRRVFLHELGGIQQAFGRSGLFPAGDDTGLWEKKLPIPYWDKKPFCT